MRFILQEVIHSMHQLKGKKGYIILKLELEKAYDRMEWGFHQAVFGRFGG